MVSEKKIDIYIYTATYLYQNVIQCAISNLYQSTKNYIRKKKTKLTGRGAGEITEEYWFMYR